MICGRPDRQAQHGLCSPLQGQPADIFRRLLVGCLKTSLTNYNYFLGSRKPKTMVPPPLTSAERPDHEDQERHPRF